MKSKKNSRGKRKDRKEYGKHRAVDTNPTDKRRRKIGGGKEGGGEEGDGIGEDRLKLLS